MTNNYEVSSLNFFKLYLSFIAILIIIIFMSTQTLDYSSYGYFINRVKITQINCGNISSVTITESMLKNCKLTIQELKNEMYKQYIHQKYRDKQLLNHRKGYIDIRFSYPKCTIQSITLQCEWKIVNNQLLQTQQSMKENLQKKIDQFYNQADAKLVQYMMQMQRKYQSLNKQMNERYDQRLRNFDLSFSQMLQQSKQKTNQLLKKQTEALIECNLRYFDEFMLIKTDLESSLQDCDFNIKELGYQISNIKTLALEKNDQTVGQIRKITKTLKEQVMAVKTNFQSSLKNIESSDFNLRLNERLMDEKLKEIRQEFGSLKNLQTRITSCDLDIKEISHQVREIEAFTLKNHNQTINDQIQVLSDQKKTVNINLQLNEELLDKDRMRVEEKFKEIEQALEFFKNMKLDFSENLNQLRMKIEEIEQIQAKKQKIGTISEVLATDNTSWSQTTILGQIELDSNPSP